jgi:hypothetical protein
MANSTECEDCGKVFPLQQNPGRCIKCQKLEPFGRDSLEYADIFVYTVSIFSARIILTAFHRTVCNVQPVVLLDAI